MENQPNEICGHLTEKASKGRFLKPENAASKITLSNKGKGKEKRKERRRRSGKEEKKKKAMVALVVFIMSKFGYSFWPKKTVGRKRSI